MEDEEFSERPGFLKKIGNFFSLLDSEIIFLHMRFVKNILDRESQAREQGLIAKRLRFETVGAFIIWLVALPCHASKYSTHKYKQAFVRFVISAVLAFLPMTLLSVFVDQVCPSYKEFFKDNIFIVWTVMTVLSLLFFVKFGLVLIRIVSCLLLLAILIASLAFTGDRSPETRSVICIVIEVVVGVFFLLWNFWPKEKMQEDVEAEEDFED
ncbi:hypothetical protein [Fibrobacter sp. UWP2]|uniref:hypothetical protein n=1 Tax=Fibrobacter sp. UWP2 TaxID=1896216 RepID=UPI0009209FE4|nr:hypothetical protein [Fibrobacter sp. UWP2]SHI81950.1 hypothetical protein SAMN05720471_10884 [Fibrobacter sp. UWP2]